MKRPIPTMLAALYALAGCDGAPLISIAAPGRNVTRIDAGYLERMATAFAAITASTATFTATDGVREYAFDGFSILTPATQGD